LGIYMAGGRPSKYCQELAEKILLRMAEGESVTKICKDADMPNKSTVWYWSTVHPEFSIQYARAISNLGSCYAESTDEIEDMLLRGEIDAPTGKIMIENRKWKAAKFYPKQFGDKSTVESQNTNFNANVEVKLSDADMAILARFGFTDS
jgi:hypothetical protein